MVPSSCSPGVPGACAPDAHEAPARWSARLASSVVCAGCAVPPLSSPGFLPVQPPGTVFGTSCALGSFPECSCGGGNGRA